MQLRLPSGCGRVCQDLPRPSLSVQLRPPSCRSRVCRNLPKAAPLVLSGFLSACFGVFSCLSNFLRSKGQSEEKKRIFYFDENVNWMESKEVLIHMFRVASTRSCVILSIFLYLISCLSFCGRKFLRANLYTQDICRKCSPVFRNHDITLSEGIDSLTFYVLFLL